MSKNHQLELAYNFVQYTNRSIFLTGKAGTGKTTFLRQLRDNPIKRMAVAAPTGVAAINAGGVTIHSFFQLPFGPYLAKSISGSRDNSLTQRKFSREKINLLQSLDLLVIDEISMVRADLLDGIDDILRRYKDRSKPFGGVQLLMIGDLHQLSPVVKEEDWNLLSNYYPNLYFFSSKALQLAAPVSIELKHIYRQSDAGFIDILNRVRTNQIDSQVLGKLNQRYIEGFKPSEDEGYITLTTHNRSAQEINLSKLSELGPASKIYVAKVKDDFPEYSFPTEVQLELKLGAQVMFVKNDSSKEKMFYNGKIGKISGMTDDKISVRCPGEDFEIEVGLAEWNNIKYELNPETKQLEERIIGSFTQFPLKLAWAITIHKSQGLTFQKAIIDAGASFAHGQVYVALSRCKSFEGLVLRSPILPNSVKTDHAVSVYTKRVEEHEPGEQQLIESKIVFQRSLLVDLFDFKPIQSKLYYYKKAAEDHDSLFLKPVYDQLIELERLGAKELFSVSEVFLRELNTHVADVLLPQENPVLQERVRKASNYFSERLESGFSKALAGISVQTDNKEVRKLMNDAFNALLKEIFIKAAVLKQAGGGFDTIRYLQTKANAEIEFSSSGTPRPVSESTGNSGVPHFGLYERIKNWRDQLARERNHPVYMILPSKAILELVLTLPSSLSDLQKVKGIGKQKVKQFGEVLLGMISSYCAENDVSSSESVQSKTAEASKPNTKTRSLELFRSGKSVQDIAKERDLAPSTVEGHLIDFVGSGELEVHHFVTEKKSRLIRDFLQSNAPTSLSAVKAAFGDEVSYNEIRAVISRMKYEEGPVDR